MEQNKDLVYLYGFSGRKNVKLKKVVNILEEQLKTGVNIKIVLIHDGVIGISKKGEIPQNLEKLINLPLTVYAMLPDLKARGINSETIHEKVILIEYEALVDILAETPKIVSWM
ncbi:MAG: sulfurtransferase complex subunit TusB [Promethearchaeota archaeon]